MALEAFMENLPINGSGMLITIPVNCRPAGSLINLKVHYSYFYTRRADPYPPQHACTINCIGTSKQIQPTLFIHLFGIDREGNGFRWFLDTLFLGWYLWVSIDVPGRK